MRIAIAGAHWVWKTTILKNLDMCDKITETARTVIKEMWRPSDLDVSSREKFQQKVLFSQMEKEENENFVSDRSVIDILAYTHWLTTYKSTKKLVSQYLNVKPYDYVFYVPIEFELVKDGVRHEWLQYQKQVDELILNLLKEFNIDYIKLSWTIEERVKTLTSIIQDL